MTNLPKLIDALRSGKYVQGYGRLTKIEDGIEKNCCLGVACQVYIENGNPLSIEKKTEHFVEDGQEISIEVTSYNGHSRFCPAEIRDWFGLNSTVDLVGKNDSKEPFEDIANYLQNVLDGQAIWRLENGTMQKIQEQSDGI